jgi:hypothetical protein
MGFFRNRQRINKELKCRVFSWNNRLFFDGADATFEQECNDRLVFDKFFCKTDLCTIFVFSSCVNLGVSVGG